MKIFKTSKLVGTLGSLLALILTLSLAIPVFAVPQIPHQFYGQVIIGGIQAEAGTTVSAEIDETVYATTTVDSLGRYGYDPLFKVPADDPETPEKEGGTNGEIIEFYVGGVLATTFTFQIGGSEEISLTVAVVDTTSPTVTINQESEQADPTNTSPINFTVVFSESVSDFATGDVTLGGTAGATTATVTGSGTTYNVAVSGMTSDGTVTASIAAGKAQDAASNPNEASTSTDNSVTYDTTAPEVTIDSTASGTTSTTPIPVTATFTETVTGFELGEIIVGNGDADNFVANGAVYTFDVTPTAYGEVTVGIAADVAADAAGNNNMAATQFSITYTASEVTIDTVTTPTNVTTQTLTGAMSEGLTVVLTADTAATFGAVSEPTTTTWSCDVSGLVEGSNLITATANSDTATATIVLDTTAPTVSSTSPVADATGVAVDATVSATFDEAMDASTITVSSFTLSGSAVAGTVTYTSATKTATFTPDADLSTDTTYTATLSTAITDAVGNPLAAASSWSFTTAAGSLGDEVDAVDSGGTVTLGTGTYSGDITITKPITITGTTGTVISGSITIGDLTGSDVTLENVTITDYTDFGIRIVKVGSGDTFIIRNNTLQGVSESVVGILVDEVETSGSLTIEQNSIFGNETGIKLLADVNDATIQFNDITSNTTAGLELVTGGNASAEKNWWGNISGPKQATSNPRGEGNEASGSASYEPWLTRQFATVQADNIAYYGYAWVSLGAGWNIFSTPIALDPEWDQWDEYVALGDPDLAIHATSPAYAFDPTATPPWVPLTGDNADYLLEPSDAIYVRMAQADRAPILYSPNFSVPSKDLYAGWNLVGASYIDNMDNPNMANGIAPEDCLASVFTVPGPNNTGYSMVVSPAVNQTAWSGYRGITRGANVGGSNTMLPCKGYWVFMTNAGTLAGTVFTPVSLLLP